MLQVVSDELVNDGRHLDRDSAEGDVDAAASVAVGVMVGEGDLAGAHGDDA
ncbi:hypothetical protein ACWF0M_01520 [Kribbella sp. NPDC055110]